MIWNASHFYAFQMDFLMDASSLQQEHKWQQCSCTHDPQLFTWQVAITIETWNVSQAVLQASSDISQGEQSCGRKTLPASLKLPKCDDACHLPGLLPTPAIGFIRPLSSSSFQLPGTLLVLPLCGYPRSQLLMVMFPRSFHACQSSCPPEVRCQKIKVYVVLFHGQMSFLIFIGTKVTWLPF